MDTVSVNTKNNLNPTEHKLYRELRELNLAGEQLLLAVSGGLDSLVMYSILKSLKPLLDVDISVAHIHHGQAGKAQTEYRNKAWEFTRDLCKKEDTAFYSNLSDLSELNASTLTSEAELREFRYQHLYKLISQIGEKNQKNVFLCLAHHQDDLLETRLIQLIRGASLQGLKAMSVLRDGKLRPLLCLCREEIKKYSEEKDLQWVEDPSNVELDPLRNWLRQEWLPQLEERRTGALNTLSRSFESILEEAQSKNTLNFESLISDEGISMPLFLELSEDEKKRVLAHYMRLMKMKNYGRSHIKEVLKRLDNSQINHTFTLLKHVWTASVKNIKARLNNRDEE